MQEEREASVQLLKTFAPLDGLKRDNLAALAKKVSVQDPVGRPTAVQGRRHRQAHDLARLRHGRNPRSRPHHRHDPRRYTRSAHSALSEDPAKRHRARDRRDQLSVHRQRAARCHDHVGPDGHLRGFGAAGAAGGRRRRRLDDDAVADQGVPSHSASQHPGDLHAPAAHAVPRGRGRHQTGRRRRLSSTSSSTASASLPARRP